MLYPIKVTDIELAHPITTITGLEKYMRLQGLVRLHGLPIGYIHMPVISGQVHAQPLVEAIVEKYNAEIIHRLLQNWLASSNKAKEPELKDLFKAAPPPPVSALPLVTVAVCTRDRTNDLSLCLAALCRIDYPYLELLVIDNAPTNNATEQLVKTDFPGVRYIMEPRPGLDWARNRAITEAKGEIIAYTDDDVIVDPKWVQALATLFSENVEVMAVTGLVMPFELETEAQVLFEQYGGFGRGFERRFHNYRGGKLPWGTLGTGQFGTGANMAFRLSIFDRIGYFDPALDVGTLTNGGGDLEMFFRVLREGYTLVYEPAAIVRHRHRREYERLKVQMAYNSKGLWAYFLRSIAAYPDQRGSFRRLWFWWLTNWNLNRLVESYLRPTSLPRELILSELQGCFNGFNLYKKARNRAIEIAKQFGDAGDVLVDQPKPKTVEEKLAKKEGIGICSIDLSERLKPLTEIMEYAKVRYFLNWNGLHLESLDLSGNKPVSVSRFIELITKIQSIKLLRPFGIIDEPLRESKLIASLYEWYYPDGDKKIFPAQLPNEIGVSVVIATYDRPADLDQCLQSVLKQKSERLIEVVVVDNNPESGLTAPVVERFPGVILINETKKGLSYARNTGISASTGEIILSTDDDVIVPPDWVENLVAPFTRQDVMVVTGNVLPVELSTPSQQLFEQYGGLGRGYEGKIVDEEWFQTYKRAAVPTWKLGACANAAFRTSIFSNPLIGMINEKLGAGTPTGCSEDTYLFYKVLKLGYTLIYEPRAFVWHNHRKTMESFNKQLYNYSKGHVAYHLETWLADNDWRAISRICIQVPESLARKLWKSLTRRSHFPPGMILKEIAGTLAGPWALFQSSRRVKKLGKSAPHSPFNADTPKEAGADLFITKAATGKTL
ncbi:MAG: putative glycosyltransferase [Ferruginibacter sp.]|nr:putative glycosyltransferase [Ferruginibacter sp.]